MKLILVILLSTTLISGCSLWPSIKSDNKLIPNKATESVCITDKPIIARKCTLLTISEISDLLKDTGSYNRSAAYTALAIGTATGSVLGFGAGSGALKGLAIASGSLLGLNTIVDTTTQISIYEKALKDMMCSIRAFDALQTASSTFKSLYPAPTFSVYSAGAQISSFSNKNPFLALSAAEQALYSYTESKKAFHFERFSKEVLNAGDALEASKTSSGTKLSSAVIATRAEVRRRLAGMVTSPEDILNSQRDRIVDMTGEIIRRRAELKKQQNTESSEGDLQAISISERSKAFIDNTSIVAAVFQECVDPATQREIEK